MTHECPDNSAQRAAGRLHEFLTAELANRLGSTQGLHLFELRWSPDMPDDDPDADLLVIDSDGREYTAEIDVWLHATGKTHQEGTP